MMRHSKLLKPAGLLAAALLAIAAPGQRPAARAATPTLNLFIWSAYIDPNLLKAFDAQCGCKVVETDYESNAELAAKLKAGGDVAVTTWWVPSSYIVPELAAEGLIQPIDHTPPHQLQEPDAALPEPGL